MSRLPSFTNPPLIETALSVQFPPIEGFRNIHLGLFWARVRDDYPVAEDAEPIAPGIELFGDQIVKRPRGMAPIRFGPGNVVRAQLWSANRQTMVQLQSDRIVYNWRRTSGNVYPRWREVLPGFERVYSIFREHLREHGLGEAHPTNWDVTYVNHLLKGSDWNTPADCGRHCRS